MNYFYSPRLSEHEEFVVLKGKEARHITGSRRLRLSTEITLFDGLGSLVEGSIVNIITNSVTVRVVKYNKLEPAKQRLILATALPKGDRINSLLDMATQLGMTDFIPIEFERSIVRNADARLERFRQVCINACKQSQRRYIPAIHACIKPRQLLNQDEWMDSRFYLMDKKGKTFESVKLGLNFKVVFIVGPEGGLSQSEMDFFDDTKVEKLRLNNAILRIETACVAAVSMTAGILFK